MHPPKTDSSPPKSQSTSQHNPESWKDLRYITFFFYVFTGLAVVAVVLHQWPGVLVATTVLWSFGAMAVGAAVGFLFGIPKIRQQRGGDTDHQYSQEVNTNLTEISDWLTKIIVGIGLIQLKELPSLLKRISAPLASSINPSEPPYATAVAVTVCFAMIGFLFGYLSTRIYLAAVFSRADQQAIQKFEAMTARIEGILRAQQETLRHVTKFVAAKQLGVIEQLGTASEQISAQIDLAFLHLSAGNYVQAKERALDALSLQKDSPNMTVEINYALVVLAVASAMTGEQQAAQDYLEKVLTSGIHFSLPNTFRIPDEAWDSLTSVASTEKNSAQVMTQVNRWRVTSNEAALKDVRNIG